MSIPLLVVTALSTLLAGYQWSRASACVRRIRFLEARLNSARRQFASLQEICAQKQFLIDIHSKIHW